MMIAALFVSLTFTPCLTGYAFAGTGQDAASAQPQANPGPPAKGPGGPAHAQMPVDERVSRLTKALTLNDDQQKQVRSILEDQQSQMMQLKKSSQSMDPSERRQKMMAIHDASTQKIKALLDDKQKKEYDQILQEQREKMQEQRGGPGPN